MIAFIVHLLLTAVLLLIVASVIRGIEIKSFGAALIGAFVLGLVNALVRPIMVFLTLPLTLLTFGLFLLVINALMLGLAAAFVPGFRVRGFVPALFGSLLLTVLNLLIEFAIPGL
jgi:putative membrane protein